MFFQRENFDENYVAQRMKDNDRSWNGNEKNLYYSVQNINCIPPLFFVSAFALLCGEGYWIIIFCLIAKYWCDYNNHKLDINPLVIKHRKRCKDFYYNVDAQNDIKETVARWKKGEI